MALLARDGTELELHWSGGLVDNGRPAFSADLPGAPQIEFVR